MQSLDNNIQAFLALVRAGLWETDTQLLPYGDIDFNVIYRLAQEQSVVGLVAAGLEHIIDLKVPKEIALVFVGEALQHEQISIAMNHFIGGLIEKLRANEIYAVLVKGQGVAQCYERPLWRACGDVDLLLDSDNYEKAKKILKTLSEVVAEEDTLTKHQALTIQGFDVELHGRMPFLLSKRVDALIDDVIRESTNEVGVRIWNHEGTEINLPAADNDVVLVFTHFLHHFFIEGVGLRQICDWCRLLWIYRESLNYGLLETRIRKAGLLTEWKVFVSLAVNTLGMPSDAPPFYDNSFDAKGLRVLKRVLKSGNFGHNKDLSYRTKYTGTAYKLVATWRRFWDFVSLVPIFPIDAPKFFVGYLSNKAR